MAARITDELKKKIVADYAEIESYRAVAKKNGVSAGSVKNIITGNTDIVRICAQKKEQNTETMLAYMDSRVEKAQGIVDVYLDQLTNPEKLDGATLSQIATALGIIIDKFTRNTSSGNDSLNKVDKLLEEFKDVVKPKTN